MRRAAAGLIACSLLTLSGCSEPTAFERLAATAAKLGDIRSGEISLAASLEDPNGVGSGFELDGVFALPEAEGELPVASFDYAQIAGDEESTAGFVSTPEMACVRVDDTYRELTPEQLEALRASTGSATEGDGSLEQLGIEDWIEGDLSEEEVEGQRVYEAQLDVPVAINDIIELARSYGASTALEPLDEAGAEQLEGAVQSSTLEVRAGADDDLLEALFIEIVFGTEEQYAEVLGDLASSTFTVDMTIGNHNEDVDVVPPPCEPA